MVLLLQTVPATPTVTANSTAILTNLALGVRFTENLSFHLRKNKSQVEARVRLRLEPQDPQNPEANRIILALTAIK